MDKTFSNDPRSIRSRHDLENAFIDLLKEMPYAKISITDITNKAGYARHTFYNHYETKENLLNSVVDSILDELFLDADQWDKLSNDPESERKFGFMFFKIWQAHADIVKILNTLDIDCLLIDRLKTHFWNYYFEANDQDISGAGVELAHYVTSLNAYSFVGVLRQWLNDGMKYSPELMGQFLLHFLGTKQKNEAVKIFNKSFLVFE